MKTIKIGDIVLILVWIAVSLVVFFLIQQKKQATTVEIRQGEAQQVYALAEDRMIELDGVGTIIIADGGVHVENMQCPDKVCERFGIISKAGESIICVPNQLVIEIQGDGGLDGIAE